MKDRFGDLQKSDVARNEAGVRFFGIYVDPGSDDLEAERIARLKVIGNELEQSGIPVQLDNGEVYSFEDYSALLEKQTGFPGGGFIEMGLRTEIVERYLAAKESDLQGVAIHYTEGFGGMDGGMTLIPILVCEKPQSDQSSRTEFDVIFRQSP